MKILFIVTGIGYGDAIREHANIEAFLKKNKKTKVLIAGYDNSYNYFKGKYPVTKIFGYKFTGRRMKFNLIPFLLWNYILPLLWWFSLFKLKRRCREFKPDYIISDFEPIGALLAKKLDKKCTFVFGYDPDTFKKFPYKNNILRVHNKYLVKLYENKNCNKVIIPKMLGSKKDKGKYHYVNPIVRKLPKGNEAKLMKELKLKKKPIVVMLGGSEFGSLLAFKIKKLAKKLNENFIIFGGKHQIKGKNIEHILFSKKVLRYIKVSKGLITLGGQKTLTEGLVLKKPMMIFPIKNHIEQLMNAYELRNLSVVKYNMKDFETGVLDFIKKIPKLQRKMNSLKIKSNGSDQVVDIVLGK